LLKNLAKILTYFAKTTASFCKNLIITLVFVKNANFFAENWQKSQKIVIITSTPGRPGADQGDPAALKNRANILGLALAPNLAN
jgi:hypothetical protein